MAKRAGLERWTVATFATATVAAVVAPVAGREQAWVGIGAAIAALSATPWAAGALPAALDGVLRRRRVASILWVLLAAISVAQMARLSAFMADSSREWGATVPEPLSTHHACLSAYIYAADLNQRGVDNLYDARRYPLFDPPGPTCRVVASPVAGLSAWISDPYEYPPQFLLLPRAALAVTRSFEDIRAWWFVLHALLLVAAGVMLARWVGGAAGLTIGLLIPAVLTSLETMFELQFGQFHAIAMVLALAGLAAVLRRNNAVGGALLSVAILSKIFPAILLVTLAVRRQWRALAWTAGWSVAFTLLALLVLGPKPFVAFATYQVPRIVNGEAFHFTHNGQHEVFLVSRNVSVGGLGAKLALLGAPAGAIAATGVLPWLYAIGLLALSILVARGSRSRAGEMLIATGLLDLAALRSPQAPSAYVLAPVLWLLVLLATQVQGRRWAAAALALGWVIVVGPPPLPDRVDLVVGMVSQALVVSLCVGVLWSMRAGRRSWFGAQSPDPSSGRPIPVEPAL